MSNELQEVVVWHFAGAQFDEGTRELRVNDETTELEPRPTEVLLLLLRRASSLVTHDEICDEVWHERHGHIGERTISNNVTKIRAALGERAKGVIETIPTKGYRITCDVVREVVHRAPTQYPEIKAGEAVRGRPSWILQECLGAGGYGQAWRATNDEGAEHVFKFSFTGRHATALKREVTLSRILQDTLSEHEDFVPVLDWDFDSVPYFIESEYSGENLSRWDLAQGWLKAARLQERLDLIVRIADAMAAAHSVGVLHRDLKPENILVQNENGSLRIRLCDFGAGRLIDPEALERLKLTALGFSRTVAGDSTAGSLLYLAPEIVRGQPSSVQSDVYSLGILLYQVVMADLSRPLATGWESEIEDELLRQDISDATHGNPQARLPSAQLLAERLRRLPGRRAELDKQREGAQKAQAAIEALSRARARRPWMYSAAALLVVGFASTSFFALRARHQAEIATEQEQLAKTQAAEAKHQSDIVTALNTFVRFDILGLANPRVVGGSSTISLKDAIVQSVPRIHQRFQKDPLIEATVDHSMAAILSTVDPNKGGVELLKHESEIYKSVYGPNDSKTLLSQVRAALGYCDVGNLEESERLLTPAMQQLRMTLKPTDKSLMEARRLEASIRYEELRFADAVPLFEQFLADEKALGNVNQNVVFSKTLLLDAYVESGSIDKASAYSSDLLAEMVKAYGDNGSLTGYVLMDIGRINAAKHDDMHADQYLARAIAVLEKADGLTGEGYANAVEARAHIEADRAQWSQALADYKLAHSIFTANDGPRALATLGAEVGIANALVHLGDTVGAKSYISSADEAVQSAILKNSDFRRRTLDVASLIMGGGSGR